MLPCESFAVGVNNLWGQLNQTYINRDRRNIANNRANVSKIAMSEDKHGPKSDI